MRGYQHIDLVVDQPNGRLFMYVRGINGVPLSDQGQRFTCIRTRLQFAPLASEIPPLSPSPSLQSSQLKLKNNFEHLATAQNYSFRKSVTGLTGGRLREPL
jgi:hypothetical protein